MHNKSVDNLAKKLQGVSVLRVVSDIPLEEVSDFYLFTGIGLRSTLVHLGHHLTWSTIARVGSQCTTVFQISNDQKRLLAGQRTQDMRDLTHRFKEHIRTYHWGRIYIIDNILDQPMLKPMRDYINSLIPLHTVVSAMGKGLDLYRASYIGNQLAPILLMSWLYPDLTPVIVTAQDQEPFFHIMRDLASRIGCRKPIMVILDPLKDLMMTHKMSSSSPSGLVPMTNLQGIMRAKSGPGPDHDFCYHLLSRLKPLDHRTSSLIQSYNPRESKKLKEGLIDLLETRPRGEVQLGVFSTIIDSVKPQQEDIATWIQSRIFNDSKKK